MYQDLSTRHDWLVKKKQLFDERAESERVNRDNGRG